MSLRIAERVAKEVSGLNPQLAQQMRETGADVHAQ
jgi:hypothetical protein